MNNELLKMFEYDISPGDAQKVAFAFNLLARKLITEHMTAHPSLTEAALWKLWEARNLMILAYTPLQMGYKYDRIRSICRTARRVGYRIGTRRRLNPPTEPFPCVSYKPNFRDIIGEPERYPLTNEGTCQGLTLGIAAKIVDYRI